MAVQLCMRPTGAARPTLEAWFARAFAIGPSERLPSVQATISAFEAAARVPVAPPAAARGRRWRVVAVGVAVALGLALPAVLLWERPGSDGARRMDEVVRDGARAAARVADAAQAMTARLLERQGTTP